MDQTNIAVFIGSLRRGSFSRKVAEGLKAVAPESVHMTIVEIGGLPIYNQDFDDDPPVEYSRFRDVIKNFDGVLFVSPEYNRSVPAVLKNAIDVGSRPYGQSVWNGKPGAVITLSPGAIGGYGANQHLRQSLMVLNVPVMPQPEAYLGNIAALFDEEDGLNQPARELLTPFMQAFATWVSHHRSPRK